MNDYQYILDKFAGIVSGTIWKLRRVTMKDTIMMIRERKGFSSHQATITIREDRDGSRIFSITGPKGCSIELPWEDVLQAGMEFVNKVASDEK